MRVAILGAGMVGRALAGRLGELGHDVHAGTRSSGTYAAAAAAGELVVNATAGVGSLDALHAAGAENLAEKVLIDVANPLIFGETGAGLVPAEESLGERIQRAFPQTRVVKALNTVNAELMIHPELVPGEHVLFICGDDAQAKRTVTELLGELGWPVERVLDLGGIRAARATEAYLLLWLELLGRVGHARFNVALHKTAPE